MSDQKVPKTINDFISDNVQALASLFPSAVKDGQVDFTALKEELGQFEEVDKEKYELTWAGKQEAKKKAQEDVFGRTLKYIHEDSKNPETTENLYIEGDNLEVLKLLRQNYYGSIKMIYIDPPYNTDGDFIYNDKFKMNTEESDIAEGTRDVDGNPMQKNSKSSNRYHAKWLNMIYPRLKVAKDLLTDDGVIFISIDDNEVSNLRIICDEIFGQDNFVTIIHVEMSTTQGMKVKAAKEGNIVKNGEYIIVYSKNGMKNIGLKPLYRPNKFDTHYSIFIEKMEGEVYKEIALKDKINENKEIIEELNLLNLVSPRGSFDLQVCYQTSPLFRKFVNENAKNIVRVHDTINLPNEFTSRINDDLIRVYKNNIRHYLVSKHNNGKFYQRIRLSDKLKKADDFYETYGPVSIRGDWWDGFYLDMGNVKKEGDISFNNGKKPIRLIYQILKFITKKDDIVLDFFSGSSTTAHAVMKINLEDKGNRQFIMVQAPEKVDSSKDKENYVLLTENLKKQPYITEIGKERIHRAGEKIKHEVEEYNAQLKMGEEPKSVPDIGFKVFRIADTNLKWNLVDSEGHIDTEAMTHTPDLVDFTFGFKDIDVVYEIMLRQKDIPLSEKLEVLSDIGTRTYLYGSAYLICLETDITEELISQLAGLNPLPIKFVFRDSAFKDDINLKDDTFRRLKILIDRNSGDIKRTYTVEFI